MKIPRVKLTTEHYKRIREADPWAKLEKVNNRVYKLEKAAAYFIAEFDENWEQGRFSMEAKTARDALWLILESGK